MLFFPSLMSLLRAGLAVGVVAVASFSSAAETAERAFSLPAGNADQSLRLFSEQARMEVLFPSDTVAGVRTRAVSGRMTPRQALTLMLAGTELVAVHDDKTGALTVRRAPRPAPVKKLSAAEEKAEPLMLSPFEVVSDSKGYYSANAMSGTRFNSRLEDLGTSITVVTKEQMADFALLDINDIFNYEAGTEGTGNYSAYSFDQNGYQNDTVQLNPNSANRIRGLNSANVTFGNFETSGRVPIDPLNIDGVEISRGPNSSIFGLGSGAGTVNSVPAAAHLSRNKAQLAFRSDSMGGYRTSLDVNRVLKPGVLAVRGSVVRQHDAFELKPSGVETTRLNGMIKARIFPSLTLSASYSDYRMHGRRPNAYTPRETITGWLQSGAPTWDPIAGAVKKGGVVVGTSNAIIKQNFVASPAVATSQLYVDRMGVSYWGLGQMTSSTDPSVKNGTGQLMNALADPGGFLASQPLFTTQSATVSKQYYDWSEINLAAANRVDERAGISSLLLDQALLTTPRHLLALQLGWFRETNRSRAFLPMSTAGVPGTGTPALEIDINERLLDGSPNPYFLRPFLASGSPGMSYRTLDHQNYRVQLAYKLDLSRETNGLRWLGAHEISGYGEYKHYEDTSQKFRSAIVDNHSWLGPGIARGASPGSAVTGGLPSGKNARAGWFNFYLGDSQGYNVDYGPSPYVDGTYTLHYGNPTTGYREETVELGSAMFQNSGTLSVLKTRGAVLQSRWLKNRLVTTVGWRHDERYSRNKAPLLLLNDGVNLDPAADRWVGDWEKGSGNTSTLGGVFKVFPWMSVYANTSDSFTPVNPALDIYLNRIADPTGKGEDYGFMFNLLQGRLALRVNQYRTVQDNRSGDSAVIGKRILAIDFNAGTSRLRETATEWLTAAAAAQGTTLSPAELEAQLVATMKVPAEYLRLTFPLDPPLGGTDRLLAKGHEIELNYNPSPAWTMKLNLVEQQSINQQLAAEIWRWLDERLAVWKTIVDPRTGRPWFTERYANSRSASEILANSTAEIAVERALEGKSRPQVRRYRANVSTNYRLSGLTDHLILKRFNLGGAVRWEDKAAIGFRGVQQPPEVVTELDVNRPIYDSAHLYVDLLAGYRTRLFANKVGVTFQLNVRNVGESGRLQPVAANPDGTPSVFRIIEPRKFILSATFDL